MDDIIRGEVAKFVYIYLESTTGNFLLSRTSDHLEIHREPSLREDEQNSAILRLRPRLLIMIIQPRNLK